MTIIVRFDRLDRLKGNVQMVRSDVHGRPLRSRLCRLPPYPTRSIAPTPKFFQFWKSGCRAEALRQGAQEQLEQERYRRRQTGVHSVRLTYG
jgi:hypothetical protein